MDMYWMEDCFEQTDEEEVFANVLEDMDEYTQGEVPGRIKIKIIRKGGKLNGLGNITKCKQKGKDKIGIK